MTARANARPRISRKKRDLNIFLSYSHKDANVASSVKEALEQAGFRIFPTRGEVSSAGPRLGRYESAPVYESWMAHIEKQLSEADAMVALLSVSESRVQKMETETFLRSTLRSDVRRPIIPMFLPGSEVLRRSSRLADFQGFTVDENSNLPAQIRALIQRLNDFAEVDEAPTHEDTTVNQKVQRKHL